MGLNTMTLSWIVPFRGKLDPTKEKDKRKQVPKYSAACEQEHASDLRGFTGKQSTQQLI